MCTALDIQDSIAPIIFGEKEVQFDVYDSATDKWSREDWECTYPNIEKLNATDITVRVNNHR